MQAWAFAAAAADDDEAAAVLPTLLDSRKALVMMMVVMIWAWVLGVLADTGAATTLTLCLTSTFDYRDRVDSSPLSVASLLGPGMHVAVAAAAGMRSAASSSDQGSHGVWAAFCPEPACHIDLPWVAAALAAAQPAS